MRESSQNGYGRELGGEMLTRYRCGLRLARQVAKREGRQKPRKKKDK